MKNPKKITNLVFEAAVVKRLKRTGWQILGDNDEDVGGHTFLTSVIAYFLAKNMKVNLETVLIMSIFHDFHEARTGDLDKIASVYMTRDQEKANRDIFGEIDNELLKTLAVYEEKKTLEAQIVYEANIIALLVELRLLIEKGNVHAQEWFEGSKKRLHLPESIKLADDLQKTDSQDWWKNIREKLREEFEK